MHAQEGENAENSFSPGYVRFTKAIERFKPLGRNTLNYRVKVSDIKAEKA